jgi:hypothetical protein
MVAGEPDPRPDADATKRFIRVRLIELDDNCVENISLLLPKARRWRRVAVTLSVSAAALAAAAGATGLSSALSKSDIGLIALASAVVAAINLGLGAGTVADDEQKAVRTLISLRSEVDSWLNLNLGSASVGDAVAKFNEFVSRLNEALALTLASNYFAGRQDRDSLRSPPTPAPT